MSKGISYCRAVGYLEPVAVVVTILALTLNISNTIIAGHSEMKGNIKLFLNCFHC